MRSSVAARTSSRRRAVAARLAGLGAAGVVAAMVAAPVALADDTPTATDTTTATDPAATDPAPASTAPDTGATSSGATDPTSDAPSSGTPSSDAPSSDGSSAAGGTGGTSTSTAPSAATKKAATQQVQADIVPNFGSQKIRVGIALDDGSYYPPGASLAGSTVQAVETGPNAPGGDPAECTTDADGYCAFDTETGFYWAAPGDTVVFTQLTAPDGPGIALNPTPQVVGPCVNSQVVLESAQAAAVAADYPACALLSQALSTAGIGAQPNVVTRDPIFGVTVTIIDPGTPPDAIDDSATVHTGVASAINVLANDVTNGAPTTITAVSNPPHGSVSIVGGHVVYKSDPGFGGTDTFTYTISTANGTDTATVHVTVLAPPVAVDDTASTFAGTAVTVHVLANDNANGGAGLAIASATTPSHGTIAFAGDTIVYTPGNGFTGTDTFTYTITTSNGPDTATVTITVVASGVGGLADTGADTGAMTSAAALLLLGGAGVMAAGRRRRVRRAH